jgi:hypothetical protein
MEGTFSVAEALEDAVGLRTRLPPSLSDGGQDGPTRPYRAVRLTLTTGSF